MKKILYIISYVIILLLTVIIIRHFHTNPDTIVEIKPKINIIVDVETTPKPIIVPDIIPNPNTLCETKTKSMGTLEITAYTACEEECDSTPNITASNQKVRLGICALSRDIEKKHKLKFGDKIFIPEHGTFEFQDRMNKRILKTVDIFMLTKTEARSFGRQTAEVFHDAGDDLNI